MPDKRIALVLGSGGARGLAHIGAIRCLEEHGYEIAYISGSSIGALIGGIYAAGKLETYASWVAELRKRDIIRLLDISFSRGAIFSGERVISALSDLIGERDIEALEIGFTAVATDINSGREVWLNRGPLFSAIRASIAMPLVFAPVERDDSLLVDGGLINPVPIAPALNAGAAMTVAIDLNGPPERLRHAEEEDDENAGSSSLREKLVQFIDEIMPRKTDDGARTPGPVDLALRSIDAMQTTIARVKLAVYSPELTVRMPANLCTFLEFHRARELIEFGHRRTQEALQQAGLTAD